MQGVALHRARERALYMEMLFELHYRKLGQYPVRHRYAYCWCLVPRHSAVPYYHSGRGGRNGAGFLAWRGTLRLSASLLESVSGPDQKVNWIAGYALNDWAFWRLNAILDYQVPFHG